MMTVRRVVAIAVYSAVRVSFGGVLYRFMTCTQGDNDVISFHIYASCFAPPSCG